MEYRLTIRGTLPVTLEDGKPIPIGHHALRELLEDMEPSLWDLDDLQLSLESLTPEELAAEEAEREAMIERARQIGIAMRLERDRRTRG